MNKSFYTFLNYLLGITAVTGLIQTVLYDQDNALTSSSVWFILVNILSVLSSILILKYYIHKKYWPVFYVGLVALFTDVCYSIVTQQALALRGSYSLSVHVIALLAAIAYGAALAFSETSKRVWLKMVGFFILTSGTVLLLINIAGISASSKTVALVKLISFTTCMIPVIFIMNFNTEIRAIDAESKEGV